MGCYPSVEQSGAVAPVSTVGSSDSFLVSSPLNKIKVHKPSGGRRMSMAQFIANPMGGSKIDSTALQNRIVRLESFLDALLVIGAKLDPVEAAETVIEESCKVLSCDRGTLYYVDGDDLILCVAKGAKNIRLPKSKGIAGHVATTGETVNIKDAWEDVRFDNSYDIKTGYRTHSVLATPIHDQKGTIIAVLQLINKCDRHSSSGKLGVTPTRVRAFDQQDVVIAENMAAHTGLVLRNADVHSRVATNNEKMELMLSVIRQIHEDGDNTQSLFYALTNHIPKLVDADRCTLYLVHHAKEQLVMMQGDVNLRFSVKTGIAGSVAMTGETVNIPDCYQDSRFNQDVDKKTGYHTKQMLCVAIRGVSKKKNDMLMDEDEAEEEEVGGGESKTEGMNLAGIQRLVDTNVVGVLQLMNKTSPEDQFSEADLNVLDTLLGIVGPIIQQSAMYKKLNRATAGRSGGFGSGSGFPKSGSAKSPFGSSAGFSGSRVPRAD